MQPNANPVAPAADRLIRLPEVISITGLSRSTIYELEKDGKFPKRCALTAKTSAWSWAEVQSFVADRLSRREADAKERSQIGRRMVEARAAASG